MHRYTELSYTQKQREDLYTQTDTHRDTGPSVHMKSREYVEFPQRVSQITSEVSNDSAAQQATLHKKSI